MAGVAGKSGGCNKLSLEAHQARGTYRRDRHSHSTPTPVVGAVSAADRKRVLAGLAPVPRRVAAALLDAYGPWNSASLETLHAYVLSCGRLERLQAADQGDDTLRAISRWRG